MMGEVEINDSWSLTAVVRECGRKARLRAQLTVDATQTTTTPTPTITNISPLGSSNNSYSQKQSFDQFVLENNSSDFMLPSAARAAVAAPAAGGCTSRDELISEMTYKPFLSKNNSMVEATNHLVPPNPQQQLQIRNLNKRQGSSAIGHHFIEKRKKYEDRRVVKCSLEELSKNEKWAWRKYGQKPIKGSPYPRNYYRCSTMKGCKARKQVERSPVDPNIYIVTYTNYHLHPYPNLRTYHGPRAKPKGSDPDPTPDSAFPFNADPGQNMSGSGPGSGSGCDMVKINKELDDSDDNEDGGGGDESFGSGEMGEESNNKDGIFMIAKATADSNLLTGIEQFCGGEKISANGSNSNSNSNNDYNKNVGFDKMIITYGRESRMNNEEVQIKDNNCLENDINNNGAGIRDMYASAPATLAGAHEPPSSVGNNIWNSSGIIKPQYYSF